MHTQRFRAMISRMKRFLLLLTLAACAPATSRGVRFAPAATPQERSRQLALTELLNHSQPYAAPDNYAEWWSGVVSVCACKPRVHLYDLQWRKLIGSTPRDRGAFWSDINVMFVLGDDVLNAQVIRHEMLHAILGGDPDHRHKAWRQL